MLGAASATQRNSPGIVVCLSGRNVCDWNANPVSPRPSRIQVGIRLLHGLVFDGGTDLCVGYFGSNRLFKLHVSPDIVADIIEKLRSQSLEAVAEESLAQLPRYRSSRLLRHFLLRFLHQG